MRQPSRHGDGTRPAVQQAAGAGTAPTAGQCCWRQQRPPTVRLARTLTGYASSAHHCVGSISGRISGRTKVQATQPNVVAHKVWHPELAPRTGWHAPSAPSLQAPRAPDSLRGCQEAPGQMRGIWLRSCSLNRRAPSSACRTLANTAPAQNVREGVWTRADLSLRYVVRRFRPLPYLLTYPHPTFPTYSCPE